MRRKLIRQGRNALTITLPSSWIKNNNLKSGETLDIIEKEKKIIIYKISTNAIAKQFEFEIKTNNPWYIGQIVRFGFLSNCDQVKIHFKDQIIFNEILENIKYLLGYEVIEQGDNYCVIKNLSLELDKEYSNLYRKIFLLTLNMFDLLIQSCQEDNYSNIALVDNTNKNILKFALFCRRVILKDSDKDSKKNMYNYILLQRLTMISNNLYYLSRTLFTDKKAIDKKIILPYIMQCKENYNIFYQGLYSKDLENILKINEARKEITEKIEKEMIKNKGKINIALHYILENIRIIASSGSILLYLIHDFSLDENSEFK
ncbi:MAG: AbrB/MazE/SpoVT family DNA-binding domain-containing protein [Nanoarchaeota archaeon]|nr:AbrB/MazE/SpoVT family DNA-binding domain-containing protein [Nanoarchaeota archaeon]